MTMPSDDDNGEPPARQRKLSRSQTGMFLCLGALVCLKLVVDIILESLIIKRHVQRDAEPREEMFWVQ